MAIQREDIIKTALQLLDEGGIEGLTLRKVAQALDIKAPSLYWHFANKQALLDAVADALIEEVARNITDTTSWQNTLRQVAHELRQSLKSHRDGARVFAGTYIATKNVMRIGETMLASLVGAGASIQFAADTVFHLGYYVMGFVIEEQAIPDDQLDMVQRTEALKAMAKQDFPLTLRMADLMHTPDFDTRFQSGIHLLLTGIEQQLIAGNAI